MYQPSRDRVAFQIIYKLKPCTGYKLGAWLKKPSVKTVSGEVSVGTAAINVGPAKQICCEHFCCFSLCIYIYKARIFGPGGCASLLSLPDPGGVLNYGNHKRSIFLKTSLAHWNDDFFFFFFSDNTFFAGFQQYPIHIWKGVHLTFWLTRSSNGEVASDLHT